ncbi:hypothetical protein FQN50_003009 [Emmonsiellopsis sp. PD_5]|nr:hypothetical protein FQN50_003009 [Emmonsiellopsis sp. PD_5]
MSLLQLPPELLFEIMEWLGPPFFRYNLARLTICKDWYYLARKVFLGHVTLSANCLERLLASPRSESFKQYLKTLSLEFSGHEEPRTLPLEDWRRLTREKQEYYREAWTVLLNNNILELATLLGDCGALDTISLSALEPLHDPPSVRSGYLHGSSLAGLLSLKSITVLELDTYGSPDLSNEGCHICACIGAMIPQLRRLRVRMCEICPDVLRPGESSTGPLFLEEVIVNLSIPNTMSRSKLPARYAKRCGSSPGRFGQLRPDIEEQAALLIQQMARPRRVRILWHAFPSLEKLSFDALTGKRMVLDEDVAWSDDGETDIEYEPAPGFDDDLFEF